MRHMLVALVLASVSSPARARATEARPTPLDRTHMTGLWTAVATDENGASWIVRVRVPEGSGGTLRIGRAYGVRDAIVSELAVDSVVVNRGRFQVHATSHDKSETWHTVVVSGVGDFRDESFGVAKAQATIRDDDGRVLFQFATIMVLRPSVTDFLADLRAVMDRIEQMGKKQ
jgi:hypothetical protein